VIKRIFAHQRLAPTRDLQVVGKFVCLFAKLPRLGDNEEPSRSSESNCHLLLPVKPFKGRTNPAKSLAQGHYHFLMLNVKQESCEYQLLKSFQSDSARKSNPGLSLDERTL